MFVAGQRELCLQIGQQCLVACAGDAIVEQDELPLVAKVSARGKALRVNQRVAVLPARGVKSMYP